MQASTLNIRIGQQFDYAKESTKLPGGGEPNLLKRLFYDPKHLPLAL